MHGDESLNSPHMTANVAIRSFALGPRLRGDERREVARGCEPINAIPPNTKSTAMAPTLSAEAWAQIRCDYEHSERTIAEICAGHGISSGTLRDRMRRWGWTRRRPPIPREGPPPLPVTQVATVPPPLPAVRVFDPEAPSAWRRASPLPAAARSQVYAGCVIVPAAPGGDPPHEGEGERETFASRDGDPSAPAPAPGRAPAPPAWEGDGADPGTPRVAAAPRIAAAPAIAIGDDTAPVEIDDSSIVPRLQSAVARVLPAIETTVARLAAGAAHPREMEQTGRALGALTRALRELNSLLSERQPPPAGDAAAGEAADDEGPEDIVAFRLELARRMDAIVAARQASDEGNPTEADPTADGDTLRSTREAECESAPRLGPHVRSV